MAKAKAKKLTAQQQRFVDEYLIDLNATQAAIRAGYSAKTAQEQSARLLSNVMVQDSVSKAVDRRSKETGITQKRVLVELARVAFGDIRKVMSWGEDGVTLKESSELSDDDAAIVSEVSETITEKGSNLKLKTHDKLRALEMVGRHLGMFKDKVEVTGEGGGAIKYGNMSDAEMEKRISELMTGGS